MTNRITSAILITAAITLAQGPPGQGGDGIWRRDAYYGEGLTFDACNGHQPGNGQYHYHANPLCLRAQLNDNLVLLRTSRNGATYAEASTNLHHSPILGWALDGYPIYGPYGYSDPMNSASSVRRIRPGFRLRSITARTSLPDWALPNHPGVSQQLSASQSGPPVNTLFPLGRYLEDYEWVSGLGDLDQYNGRFAVTPEFPSGTYAYYVTIDANGAPAFPYILSGQFYGTTGAFSNNVPSAAADYFNAGTFTAGPSIPALTSWSTTYSAQYAKVVSGFDPSAGPSMTWPPSNTLGVRTSGGVSAPTLADIQRIRYTDSTIYVTANGLAGYQMGPWFSADMRAGIFTNFPSANSTTLQIPRNPSPAASKPGTGGGAQGLWVNGVAGFNFIDGASYSSRTGTDAGGGNNPAPEAVVTSAASFEQGPIAPGSLVTAWALYSAALATSTASADSPDWPFSLGGASVTVTDSAGTTSNAQISFASSAQLNFRVPEGLAAGAATVTISAGGQTMKSNINLQPVYPNLFLLNANALAAGAITRVHNGESTTEQLYSISDGVVVAKPIALNGDVVYVTVYGSGLGSLTLATATIGGAAAVVQYAGPQGTYKGLDQFNILIPGSLSGAGKVDVVITASGKPSNPANITVQ